MALVYLSLGSNLGNRDQYLEQARKAIEKSFSMVRFSKVYETEPVDVTDQPWFLNQVAELRTDLAPETLLEWARILETQAGRQRETPKDPGPWMSTFFFTMTGFWMWKNWFYPILDWNKGGMF